MYHLEDLVKERCSHPSGRCPHSTCALRPRGSGKYQLSPYCEPHSCLFFDERGRLCDRPRVNHVSYCEEHIRCKGSAGGAKCMQEVREGQPGVYRFCWQYHNCVEDGCHNQRRWFGGRDMRRCDEHRCHFHDCTERRDRSDYCPDHKCRFDGCRDGITNGLGHYCARHEIFRDGGGVGVRPSGAIPPCLFDGCEYPSLSGRRYCRFHECEVRECTLPLMAGVSNFCFEHKCRVCSGKKPADGRFCSVHRCAQLDCEDRALNGGWCDTHWTRRRRRRRTGSRPPGVWFEGAGDHNGDDLDYLDYGDDDDDDDGYDGGRARRRSRGRETPGRGGSPARVCLFRTGSGPVPDRICNQRAERGRQYCTRHLCRDYHCDAPARGETSYFCRHHECERDGCRRKVHDYDGPGFTMPGPSFVCARHRRCAIEGCGRDVDGYVIDALCSRHRFFGGPFRGSEGLL